MKSRTFIRAGLLGALLILWLQASFAADKIPARTDFGTAQLAAIQARYDATPDDCGGPDQPAFLCSTVIFRVTGNGVGYHVWNPSPTSVATGGVSFSYLRTDLSFGGLAWDDLDGLIFSPQRKADAATVHPAMLCIFPIEAHTWHRSEKACGIYSYAGVTYPSGRPCQSQNILTAEDWFRHVTLAGAPIYPKQCGFTIAGAVNPAPAFLAALKAHAFLMPGEFGIWNELILATWPQNIGASLPIEAFFYVVKGTSSGLAGARRNQRDLLNTDGVAVPIVRFILATTPSGKTTFTYTPGDQAITPPTLPATLDQPPAVALAPAGQLAVQDILAHPFLDVSVPAQPGIAAGSTAYVHWTGTRASYDTPARPVASAAPTVFAIPRGSVLATLGQTVNVSYVVTEGTIGVERASPVFTVTVAAASGSLPPPVLAADRSTATIGYPGMLSTDQIWVSYEGNGVHDTPFPKKTAPFNAGIAPSWLGAPDQVYYWVKRGTQYLVSPVLTPTRGPWPILPDAANGWLDFAALTVDPVVTLAPWDGIAAGQSVWLDALAYFPDGSEQRAPLVDGIAIDEAIAKDGLRTALSRDWLRRLPDGSAVFLRARVGTDVARARAFPVTRLTLRNAPGPILTKPLPRLVDVLADGSVLPLEGLLSRSALKGTLQARVAPWPGMLLGQRVWLRLRGRKADGSALTIDLAANYALVQADLTGGLARTVPLAQLDALADQSSLVLELKVGFEKLTDEARARRFPIDHLAYGQ